MVFSTWQPGMLVTADRLNASTPQPWTPWTPSWSTSTGAALPSFGNATVDCQYTTAGATCSYYMHVQFGSTTNFGSGASGSDNWLFSLPLTAAQSDAPIGGASYFVGSSTDATPGIARLHSTTDLWLYVGGGDIDNSTDLGVGIVDSLTPVTWASGNRFMVTGQYELA